MMPEIEFKSHRFRHQKLSALRGAFLMAEPVVLKRSKAASERTVRGPKKCVRGEAKLQTRRKTTGSAIVMSRDIVHDSPSCGRAFCGFWDW